MNVTYHGTIPGLYNAWDEEVFSTIQAMNLPEGRVWRTNAYLTKGDGIGRHLGDFATCEKAVDAVKTWKAEQ
jgi:hypothetical protein